MILTTLACVAIAQSLSAVDQDFLTKTAEDNIAELQMVKMVDSKSKDTAVKHACQIMIQDHTKNLQEVKQLGSRLHVDLPTEPNAKHKALYEHMSKRSGKDLDKAFTSAQIEDHIGDINDAHDETEVGNDKTLREFANRNIKMYAKHAEIWRAVARKLGVNSTFGRPSAAEILKGAEISD